MTGRQNGSSDYIFGDFRYRISDGTLRYGDEIRSMTPKALELLKIFIANPGELLSKDQLMNSLWPDSFVEESNLAVTVRRLRKELGDDAHAPRFVETVPRKGYRFIAEVARARISEPIEHSETRPRSFRYLMPMAVAAGLLIASISFGSLYLRGVRSDSAPILGKPFSAEKFSASGNVGEATISPDGQRIVYSVRGAAGESVWMREVANGNNVEIIPVTNNRYYGFEVSPDGSTLYFTRGERSVEDPADIYRVSLFGGVPTKIAGNTRGWISLSPDGSAISFVRCRYTNDENCSLWIADSSDGGNERLLVSTQAPYRVGDNKISPDGKTIVYAVGQTENSSSDFTLSSVDIETGTERSLTDEKFFEIKSVEVLPDMTGALISASRRSTRSNRVWQVDFADGSVRPLTRDTASYFSISLDRTGSRIVGTQTTSNFRIVDSKLDLNESNDIADSAEAFSFDHPGDLVYQSDSTGDIEIWRMEKSGSGRRQLTTAPGDDIRPIVRRDDGEIFFCSNRSGAMQVWRMKSDGSDQTQVTQANGGIPAFAGRDWVYYQHGIDRSLWRVSLRDGTEQAVFTTAPYRGPFVFSHDGAQAVFVDMRNGSRTLVVIDVPDGRESRSFEIAEGNGRIELAWLPGDAAIGYSMSDPEGQTNSLWVQSFDGGAPQQTGQLGNDPIIFLAFLEGSDSVAFSQGRWKHDLVMIKGLQ